MRKAIFAVVLVSASFAGGAFVNGPGLQWAQQQLMSRLGIDEETADASTVDADSVVPSGDETTAGKSIAPLASEPTEVGSRADRAKDKPKAKDKDRDALADADGDDSAASRPRKPAAKPKAAEPSERTASRSKSLSASSELPGLAPVPEGTPPPIFASAPLANGAEGTPPPIDPPAPLASGHEKEREALSKALATAEAAGRDAAKGFQQKAKDLLNKVESTAEKVADKAPDDASVFRAALGNDPPPAEPLPSSEPPAAEPAPVPVPEPTPAADAPASPNSAPSSAPATGDWSEIRRQMKTLGVSRYGVEGEPSGRVRFFCVIPLAGRRAVGQHFEAEGDDEIQAAQAALRRVALWKATEHPE